MRSGRIGKTDIKRSSMEIQMVLIVAGSFAAILGYMYLFL
jgi:hypothetical protein